MGSRVTDQGSPCIHPSSVNPSLNVLPSSAGSTLHSTKVPSICIIQRNTHGCRCSLENVLLTSVRVLSVQRGQPSHERLPLLLINCRTKGGINRRLDGSEEYSRRRESMLHPGVMPYKCLGNKSNIFHHNNENNQLERRVQPPRDVPQIPSRGLKHLA